MRLGEQLAQTLASIEPARPDVDRELVEASLGAHLHALCLYPREVRWVDSPRALLLERRTRGGCGTWPAHARRRAELVDALPLSSAQMVGDVWERARTIARLDLALRSASLPRSPQTRAVYWPTRELANGANGLMSGSPPRSLSGRSLYPALVPLAEALAAGLLCYAIGPEGELVAVPRPELRLDDRERLHDWDGNPAALWPDDYALYFWRGVHMTDAAGRHPHRVTVARALGWTNAERRRVALERLEFEHAIGRDLLEALGGRVVQRDDYGRLWRARLHADDEPYVAVEVVNATAEPDGSRKRYVLRVPPDTRTARQAVAWTFGFDDPDAYRPVIET
jgi:hypothetical protein